jgi:hypothetical protein
MKYNGKEQISDSPRAAGLLASTPAIRLRYAETHVESAWDTEYNTPEIGQDWLFSSPVHSMDEISYLP